MFEIIILACMASQPENCKVHRLTFAGYLSNPYQCANYGQIEAAEWVRRNPEWIVRKFKCGDVQVAERGA